MYCKTHDRYTIRLKKNWRDEGQWCVIGQRFIEKENDCEKKQDADQKTTESDKKKG